MAKVEKVAYYVLDKLGPTDTWKLQKLVYYCQAWSLVWDDSPLFDSRIEAWANGPVCPELYRHHGGQFRIDKSLFESAKDDTLTQKEKETIDAVLDHYGDKEGYWLRELTHLEDPWIEARGDIPEHEASKNEITIEMMQNYYGSL